MARRPIVWLSLAAFLVGIVPPPAALAQPAPAGVVTTLEGRAVVARAVAATPAAAPVPLKFKDSVFPRDRIETRQDSIVRVLLGGKALVTVRELSVFTITEEPGRARIDLAEGKAAVGVAKSLLRPGEVIEIRTPNAVAAVRGSEIVAEVGVVAGVPQSSITALDVSLPVTVTLLADPTRVVTLGINQAVSVLGLGPTATLSSVRSLTATQVQDVGRASRAPKPREQSDKPPERIARKVSQDKTQEAAQLSEAVVGGDASAVSAGRAGRAMASELDNAEQNYRNTQELLDVTKRRTAEIFEATGALIDRSFAAERLALGFEINAQTLSLDAADTLTFSGTDSLAFNPIGGVAHSQIVQTGAADLFAVAPGADIAFEGSLLFVGFDSLVSTEGNLFSVGPGAVFTSGFGGSSFVAVQFNSVVLSGGSIVAIGPGAHATFERSLVFVDETSAVVVGRDAASPTSVVDVGPGAQVRLEQGLDILSVSGTMTATGSLLSIGEGASLSISTDAGGLASLGIFPGDGGPPGATVTTGNELVVLKPRARLTTNQPLIAILGSTVMVGSAAAGQTPAAAKDLLALEREAVLITSAFELISVGGLDAGASTLTVTGNLVSVGEGAALVSESELSVSLIGIDGSTASIGRDVVAVRPGATLRLGPQSLLQMGFTTLSAGGSLLSVAKDAVVTLAGTFDIAVFGLLGSLVETGADMVSLAADAALAFERPLFIAVDTLLIGHKGLLALGDRASLTVPDLTTVALIFLSGGGVSLAGDAVWLGAGARLDLNRPLIFSTDGATFEAGGSVLTLRETSALTSGGGDGFSALIDFEGGPTRAGAPAVVVHPGARMSLDGRPLLISIGSDLTLPGGALRVHGGGQVSLTPTAEFLVGIAGGTHAIGTAPGASVLDLAGLATAVDAESQLTLGTDRPVQYGGNLFFSGGATLGMRTAVRLDTALLEATAPLLDLRGGTAATASADVLELTARAKLSGVGPLVSLDGSSLSVLAGALANVAGGSFLKVVGDLLELRNGSTLSLLNGPVLSVTGGSAVSVTGGLVAFGGTGGNRLNVTNSLCPCTLFGGLPVALQNGASPANVSIGPNPIRNGSLGTVALSPNAAAIVVSGPASRVTIGAP